MSDLTSKTIIVTGALGGIGRASARVFATAGARVVGSDLGDAGGKDFVDELTALGAEASYFAADLQDEGEVAALVGHAVERFGRLDGAFNNAGVPQQGKPLADLTSEEFERVLRINVLGVFHCVKHQMKVMDEGSAIVNTSSGLGVMAIENAADYIASKHAVCGLTRAAAVEGALKGVRVNAILPGMVRTPMVESVFAVDDPEFLTAVRSLHLIPRLAEAEEIGNAARWLLSNESSFVTGALIPVEGGTTAGRPGA